MSPLGAMVVHKLEEINVSMIRTAKRENPFVQLDKYCLNDDSISYEAKGILAYVLSKPDTWSIRKNDLVKRSTSGKTRIETALLELMAAGYLNWYQLRSEDGTFGDWVYDVYERPEFNPNAEKIMEEGKTRISERKKKNKKKHATKKKDTPEIELPSGMDEPKAEFLTSVEPKAEFPTSDNPTSENQPYSNTELKDIELSNNLLKKEEEEDIYIGESGISQEFKDQGQKPIDESEKTSVHENQRTADELIQKNPSYEYLSDFLSDKEVRSNIIADVIIECEKYGLDTFKVIDVEGQYKHMMSKVDANDTIYDFTSYFVGGLKRRIDLSITNGVNAQHEAQRAAELAANVRPLHNWLENRG